MGTDDGSWSARAVIGYTCYRSRSRWGFAMSNESRDELLRRIQGEYLAMPGLQLNPFQAQRLWALDRETCATILEVFVDRQFLIRGPDDRYRRVSDGNVTTRENSADQSIGTTVASGTTASIFTTISLRRRAS
jgi:hypothetical protein